MGVTDIIVFQKALQSAVKVLSAGKTPTGQKATGQDTKKQLSLVEPRAVFWREMKDMAVAWITQKGSALHAFFELLRLTGHLAPPSHQATDVQTPVGVQVVHDPIITFHAWQVLISPLEMGHEIGGLTGGTDGPSELARGHRQGVDQHPRAMADVLMFTPFAPARLCRFGGRFALEHLHAGLFIAANHQAALLIGLDRLGVKLANSLGFGIKVLIVAIQPVLTLVRLEINVLKDTPDT